MPPTSEHVEVGVLGIIPFENATVASELLYSDQTIPAACFIPHMTRRDGCSHLGDPNMRVEIRVTAILPE
ncbi:MAG TPA: hypothetical protein VK638_34540 [Edaphobacter sp.]|nr:hypothetical protein [Edaphobacter sp.]